MPDIGRPGHAGGEPPDGDQQAVLGELFEEGLRGEDLEPGRAAIRGLRPGMGGDNVPAEHVETELGKNTLDDRGRRFGRPAAGELALGGEWEARDAGASIARRLADQ